MSAILSYLFCLLIISSLFLYFFKNKKFYCVFFAGEIALLLSYLVGFTDLSKYYNSEILFQAFSIISISNLLLFFMIKYWEMILLKYFNYSSSKFEWSDLKNSKIKIFINIYSIIYALFNIIFFLNDSNRTSWWADRITTNINLELSIMNCLGLFVTPLIVIALYNKKWFTSTLMFFSIYYNIIVTGARPLLFCFIGIFLYIVLNSSQTFIRRLLLLIPIGILFFATHILGRAIRVTKLSDIYDVAESVGISQAVDQKLDGLRWATKDVTGGEKSIVPNFLFALENPVYKETGVILSTVKRALLVFVPRVGIVKEFKPIDVNNTLWNMAVDKEYYSDAVEQMKAFKAKGSYGTLHSLFAGDAIANGPWWAFIIYHLFFSGVFVLINFIINYNKGLAQILIISVGWLTFLTFARGSVSTGFTYTAYHGTLVLLSVYFINNWNKMKLNFLRKR